MSRPPLDMKTAPDSPAKKSSEAADPADTNQQGHAMSTTNDTAAAAPVGRLDASDMPSEAAEDVAVRLILDRDPVALACHRLGLESRSLPKPARLHPDDVALIARQVAVELNLGEQAAQAARIAQNGSQRYAGTALGDRVAAGREHNPYPIHTADELDALERRRRAA